MSTWSHIGDGVVGVFYIMFWGLILSAPLAIWKLIDIGVWLYHHIQVGVSL